MINKNFIIFKDFILKLLSYKNYKKIYSLYYIEGGFLVGNKFYKLSDEQRREINKILFDNYEFTKFYNESKNIFGYKYKNLNYYNNKIILFIIYSLSNKNLMNNQNYVLNNKKTSNYLQINKYINSQFYGKLDTRSLYKRSLIFRGLNKFKLLFKDKQKFIFIKNKNIIYYVEKSYLDIILKHMR